MPTNPYEFDVTEDVQKSRSAMQQSMLLWAMRADALQARVDTNTQTSISQISPGWLKQTALGGEDTAPRQPHSLHLSLTCTKEFHVSFHSAFDLVNASLKVHNFDFPEISESGRAETAELLLSFLRPIMDSRTRRTIIHSISERGVLFLRPVRCCSYCPIKDLNEARFTRPLTSLIRYCWLSFAN